jgi:UDP-3-O-[3-hydroxymyristoyl] glucosamine N-acyltransferase
MVNLKFSLNEVLTILKKYQIAFTLSGEKPGDLSLTLAPAHSATESSMIFIDAGNSNPSQIIEKTKAPVILCSGNTNFYNDKLLIGVENPKYTFALIVNNLLKGKIDFGIHPSATIHPEAIISDQCYIGPNTYVGKSTIGNGTIIYGNCYIYDNVSIGENVIIDAGCTIGAAGFGFVRDSEGIPIRFPQLGGVEIEDDVEIGANTCIDRGALSNTIIKKGVKIDNLVQIAHNCIIGEYTYIIAHTIIAGSVTIGKKCWIAPSRILNKVTIGDNVTVGYGAVVLNNISSNETYMGYPATKVERYSKLQYKLKKL